jgi:hypothetical protein
MSPVQYMHRKRKQLKDIPKACFARNFQQESTIFAIFAAFSTVNPSINQSINPSINVRTQLPGGREEEEERRKTYHWSKRQMHFVNNKFDDHFAF